MKGFKYLGFILLLFSCSLVTNSFAGPHTEKKATMATTFDAIVSYHATAMYDCQVFQSDVNRLFVPPTASEYKDATKPQVLTASNSPPLSEYR